MSIQAHAGRHMEFSTTVEQPSRHRLHLWGSSHGLGAHPGLGAYYPPSRHAPHPAMQHSISAQHPLSTRADEIVRAPSFWLRAPPDAAVFSKLSGCHTGSPRLTAFDSTLHQGAQDLERQTSYAEAFARPAAAVWTPMTRSRLPPLTKREAPPQIDWLEDALKASKRRSYSRTWYGGPGEIVGMNE